jgi:hypothetical protein
MHKSDNNNNNYRHDEEEDKNNCIPPHLHKQKQRIQFHAVHCACIIHPVSICKGNNKYYMHYKVLNNFSNRHVTGQNIRTVPTLCHQFGR